MKKIRYSIFTLLYIFLFACTEKEAKQSFLGDDAITTDSGLEYVYLSKGNGPNPNLGDEVQAHCVLKVGDSSEVWNTRNDGEPFIFTYAESGFISGWIEIMGVAKVGDRIKVIIPPDMGYGAGGSGEDIPGNAILSFDIEVLQSTDQMLWIADSLYDMYVTYGKDAARAYYKKLKSDPDTYSLNEKQLKTLGQRLHGDGRLNDHFETTRIWAEEFPESVEAHYVLALVFNERGQKSLALEELNRCLEIDPDNPVVQGKLAEWEQ